MYIIIAGGGLIGKGLAVKLVQQKHDVVVIDIDPEVCEEIYAKHGAVTITGTATDLETLESAGIERCDVAVASLRNDADNMVFALLAKHHRVPQIIVRMNNAKYEDLYKAVGVENVARTTDLLIDQMLVNIESPELRKVIGLGSIEICIFNIPEHAVCDQRTVAEITTDEGFPSSVAVTCIFQDVTGRFVVPRGDTRLRERDRVFLCGAREDIKKAVRRLC